MKAQLKPRIIFGARALPESVSPPSPIAAE